MVLPVRMRIHWGSGRFCFCFFPKIFLTLKVLLDGYVEKETRIRRQSRLWLKITLSDRATELLGSCTDADPRTCTPYTDDIHRTRRHKPHERALSQTHVRVSTARAASRVAPPASTRAKTPARAHAEIVRHPSLATPSSPPSLSFDDTAALKPNDRHQGVFLRSFVVHRGRGSGRRRRARTISFHVSRRKEKAAAASLAFLFSSLPTLSSNLFDRFFRL